MKAINYIIITFLVVATVGIILYFYKRKKSAKPNKKENTPQVLFVSVQNGLVTALVKNADRIVDQSTGKTVDITGEKVAWVDSLGNKKEIETEKLKQIQMICNEVVQEQSLARYGFPDYTLVNSAGVKKDDVDVYKFILSISKRGVGGEYIRVKEYESKLFTGSMPTSPKIAN